MKQLFKHNRVWSILFALIGIGVLALSIAFPEASSYILAALGLGGAGFGGSILAVGTTVVGPVTVEKTAAANSEHLARDVSDIITMRKPDDAPLDTLIRKIAKKKAAHNYKVEWEEVSTRGTEDTLTATNTAAGSSADDEVDLAVTNTTIWNANDTGIVPTVNGGDGNPFNFFVVSVDTDADTITVRGINGSNTSGEGFRVPTIASGTKIYRLGPASYELQASIGEKYQVPTTDYNYCQTHQKQLSEGLIESKHKAYSGYNFQDKKNLEIYDYRSQMEGTHLFGNRRKKTIGNEVYHFAGGIINKISNSLTYGSGGGATDISINDIIDIHEAVFAPNNGSSMRYLIAGSTLVGALNKIDTSNRRLRADEHEIVTGWKVTKLISNFGEMAVIHSKTLDSKGDYWKKRGLILDMDHLVLRELEPMIATDLELNKSGQKKVKSAFRLDWTGCIETRYAGSGGVHAIIGPDPNT